MEYYASLQSEYFLAYEFHILWQDEFWDYRKRLKVDTWFDQGFHHFTWIGGTARVEQKFVMSFPCGRFSFWRSSLPEAIEAASTLPEVSWGVKNNQALEALIDKLSAEQNLLQLKAKFSVSI